VRQSNDLGAVNIPLPTGAGGTMAGLVEEARWRTSQKGRRFLMARFSDGGGQYDATVFDDEAAAMVEAAAKAGQCGLLSVELDRRPARSSRGSP
jgi:DNA polymerase-3 subunit alpha